MEILKLEIAKKLPNRRAGLSSRAFNALRTNVVPRRISTYILAGREDWSHDATF
jgi:hypothetical protein